MSDLIHSAPKEMAKHIDYYSAEEGDVDAIFHPNQTTAALKIIDKFKTKFYVQFQAQMQAGKTGCSLFTAFKMIEKEMVKKFFIISGMSDTDLKNQWSDKIVEHKSEYMLCHQNDLSIKNKRQFCRTLTKSLSNIYFNSQLKTIINIEMLKDSIIIIDEVHYGSKQKSQIHNLFERLGIRDILEGKKCPKLEEYNIKILTVSATRATEDAVYNDLLREAKNNWGRVYMEPGRDYKGIIDYFNEDQIKTYIELVPKNENKIIELFNKYRGRKKYFAIRAVGKKNEYIEELIKTQNIPIQYYDQTHRDNFDTIEPQQFTVVIIKGRLRLGKELDKTHICAVFESSDESMHNDTLLQGLPGRVCGYKVRNPIDMYIPRSEEQIEELVKTFEKNNQNIAEVGLDKCKFVAPVKRNSIPRELCPKTFPYEDEEPYSKWNIDKLTDFETPAKKTSKDFTYTIPQTLYFDQEDPDEYSFMDLVMNIPKHEVNDDIYRKILSKVDTTKLTKAQQNEYNNVLTNPNLAEIGSNLVSIRNTHRPTGEQTKHDWLKFSRDKLNKKQFTGFHKTNIIIVRCQNDIQDTCLKKNTLQVYFRFENENGHIETPFIAAKQGSMHTPTDSTNYAEMDMRHTIEDYSQEECENFKNNKQAIIEEIKRQIEHFKEDKIDVKKLTMRHSFDKTKKLKDHTKKPFIGIISNYKKNELIKKIEQISIQGIKIEHVIVPGINDSDLTKQHLYKYKEIEIIMSKID